MRSASHHMPNQGDKKPPSGVRPAISLTGLNSFEYNMNARLEALLAQKAQHKRPVVPPAFPAANQEAMSPYADEHPVRKGTDNVQPPSFTTPPSDNKYRFTRNSADNINTRFVAEEKPSDGFEFNAGGDTTGDAFMRAKQRSRSTPRGRQSPLRTGTSFATSGDSGENAGQHATAVPEPTPEAAPKPSGFNPEEWAQKFEPHHFVPPPVNKPVASPTRSRSSRKTKPVLKTAGTAGLVDEEDTSGEDKTRPSSGADDPIPGPSFCPSPNAMDIDTPTPPGEHETSSHGARNINVEPSKPEWRAGDVNGVKPGESSKVGSGLKQPPFAPSLKPMGSEDTDHFTRPLFNALNSMDKASGLGSFNDIKSNLPFKSQASAKLHLDGNKAGHHHQAQTVKVPKPPQAPKPPAALAVASLKPGGAAWTQYVKDFDRYAAEWETWNRALVDHFSARQAKNEIRRQKMGSWVDAVGDSGIQENLDNMEMDRLIRQSWMLAWERHEQQVREFYKHKQRMRE